MLGFQLLNGLTFAALLFVVASGFTLVFGLLRIVNLAHGALYLLGGYVAYEVGGRSGSFALGVVAAMLAVALAGLALDRGLLRFVKGQDLRQVLLTVGVGLVLNDLFLVIWGGDAFTVPTPEALQGAAVVMGVFYPKYRLFVLLAGVTIFVLLWLVMNRTRYGALIRAGVDDAEM
ncbi:MAG: branched-chain amino acid ABC transporter permease, partial [Rhodospirillales bacterium]|nr:branched-chain amino acid ABC transporter permease [Rhodospirillales bacterium]